MLIIPDSWKERGEKTSVFEYSPSFLPSLPPPIRSPPDIIGSLSPSIHLSLSPLSNISSPCSAGWKNGVAGRQNGGCGVIKPILMTLWIRNIYVVFYCPEAEREQLIKVPGVSTGLLLKVITSTVVKGTTMKAHCADWQEYLAKTLSIFSRH